MVEIKEMSREFTKVEKYLMTTAPDIEPLKNITDGESISVDGFMIMQEPAVRPLSGWHSKGYDTQGSQHV